MGKKERCDTGHGSSTETPGSTMDRLSSMLRMGGGYEPRQTTSIIGHLNKPSIQALIHGLNRHYYSIAISYRKSELEEKMLMNLHKKGWTEGLKTADFKKHDKDNEETVKRMLELAKAYNKAVQEEDEKTAEKFQIDQVGKLDAKKHLQQDIETVMSNNIVQVL